MKTHSRSKKAVLALAVAAMSLGATHSFATVVYSTSFEPTETPAYANGASVGATQGWSNSGTGVWTSLVPTSPATPRSGAQAMQLAPPSASTASFHYRTGDGAGVTSRIALGETTVTTSMSVALIDPASGTINRGMFAGYQLYTSSLSAVTAYEIVEYDPNYVADGFTGAWTLTAAYRSSLTTTTFLGSVYTFPSIPNTFAGGDDLYFDLQTVQDLAAGTISYYLGGSLLFATTPGDAPFMTTANGSQPVVYGARLTANGVSPRALFDDYSVSTAVPTPEPASVGLLVIAAGTLARRRRQS